MQQSLVFTFSVLLVFFILLELLVFGFILSLSKDLLTVTNASSVEIDATLANQFIQVTITNGRFMFSYK